MMVGSDSTVDGGVQQENKSGLLGGIGGADMMRQVIMILALAICLALAVFVMMWAQEPDYRPLGKMETAEMIQVLDVLDKNQIEYQINVDVVKVPEDKYQEVKLLLSRAGIQSSTQANDYLSQDSGFGVSQRMEQARLKQSQEQNLARAIEELKSISRAKVILALPKENVFARNASKPSATVVVSVRRGGLGQEEIDAIVDIVGSAVQGLEPSRVTVTDSNGRLLNSGSQDGTSARARREQELVQQQEAEYRKKIDSILMPILGPENFTSQVDVNMNFTAVEQTAKRFSPDLPAIRSEMTIERNSTGGSSGGIPGALSNQPPMESDIPQVAGEATASTVSGDSSKEATRNYELDTTISHTRQQIGVVRRVSVSVAINFKPGQVDENGQVTRVARTEQELTNIRRLLEGAVGFSTQRGDALEVVTVPFMDQLIEELPEPDMWEQPWFWRAIKLALGAIVILVLILAVVRPMLKKLTNPNGINMPDDVRPGHELAEIEDQYAADTLGMLNTKEAEYSYADDGSIHIPNLHKDDDMIKAIRALVANEPELSTQVVKNWLQDNG
ncbi:flagellar M-ring protein FliF [Shewanella sp. SR43-4]|jgi:flagellar M-ring protein FliF|uniref:Flagellar M-ring protein n=1 Tax=Shewanella vesiculosa TaxID=518738 RepID=A0ABV0FLX4_9GAMM|nr:MULTISPECIES: flagellar basal-body MS-ring/collar protein FliF [Shewanella]NCQ46278.1 flagellar basal body M-ring protein FliF [Shewanella frigidimarina]MBB1318194.1 flagellar M-ring protein FliF [Shewanella sp. SR43-4]MBB1320130.1 flagellar M-ring protein FliF [Shewanella sp. SR43-8]MBB1390748.1 flagellar M-ring protein FliF [Shewanella sp. SG44-6]MBB1477464.1 flagellar M-ring protein FliF [Shewanella sp. SG41-3]|tara:strand:+ start:19101 stop:20780 length:1680 start_codon:yes stop_codon:yes gene_type:complete